MTVREIEELAAILVNEHGDDALQVAERRRAEHARQRASDAFRVWTAIAAAVADLVGAHPREKVSQDSC